MQQRNNVNRGGSTGGGGSGGNKKPRKTGPYHQIITAQDLDLYPLSWGGISVSTVNGTPHAHALGDFVDPNARGDFVFSAQLLIPGDEDTSRWVTVVDQAIAGGLIQKELRDAYISKDRSIAKDIRLTNELSALVVLPGDKTGFSLKAYVGLPGKDGQPPEMTLHHRITAALMTRLKAYVAEFLDANLDFKKKFLLDGLKDKSAIKALMEKPTIDLIVSPLQESKYKEDVKNSETGELLHEAGDKIVSDPDVISFRPTISYLDNGGDKSTTPGAGCFAFNYRDADDDTYLNAIWWTPTIVPVLNEQGRTIGQKMIENIIEEREWMYCSKANVPKDWQMKVGEKPFFTIGGNVLKAGIPMLHSSEGKISITFFCKKNMFLKRNYKSGDNNLEQSVQRINMAALMGDYEDEKEPIDDGDSYEGDGLFGMLLFLIFFI